MKIFNENREELIVELVKFTIFFILFIITMNGFNTKAGLIRFRTNPSPSAVQSKVRTIYTTQIGIRERQVNAGPEVEKYLRYVGLSKGNPWCAAFVCWVYGQAGVPNPRSGWSPSLFGRSKLIWFKGQAIPAAEAAVTVRDPSRAQTRDLFGGRALYPSSLATGNWQQATPGTGDIFGLFFPEKARIAHVGFVDQWDGTWMISVEGNTNISGSREGDGVYRKRRLIRSIYKVARYISPKK